MHWIDLLQKETPTECGRHHAGREGSGFVAELEGGIRDPNFLGTLALAGSRDLEDGIDVLMKAQLPVLNGLVARWVYGTKTLYPDLELKDILTPNALALYNKSVGVFGSLKDQMDWIAARFAGDPALSNCPAKRTTTRRGGGYALSEKIE